MSPPFLRSRLIWRIDLPVSDSHKVRSDMLFEREEVTSFKAVMRPFQMLNEDGETALHESGVYFGSPSMVSYGRYV